MTTNASNTPSTPNSSGPSTPSNPSAPLSNPSSPSSPSDPSGSSLAPKAAASKSSLLDELTFTLGELNKAMDNVNYMAEIFKDLDLAKLLKGASKTKWKELLKKVDLKQVQSFLESPLVQQIIADPELLSLFVPQLAPNSQQSSSPPPGNHQGAQHQGAQHPAANPAPYYSPFSHRPPAPTQPSQPIALTRGPYGPYRSIPYSAYQPTAQQGQYQYASPATAARLKSRTPRS